MSIPAFPPRPLTALLLAGALVGALAAPAPAAAPGLTARALALVAAPHEAFLAAPRSAPFDWSSDGCSRTPAPWARIFDGPCRQHDFGYRNLGRGLRLQRTEATRRWVDERLLAESRRLCAARPGGAVARALCDARARAMHTAVRLLHPRWAGAQVSVRPVPAVRSRSAGSPKTRCRRPFTTLTMIAARHAHQKVSISKSRTSHAVM